MKIVYYGNVNKFLMLALFLTSCNSRGSFHGIPNARADEADEGE